MIDQQKKVDKVLISENHDKRIKEKYILAALLLGPIFLIMLSILFFTFKLGFFILLFFLPLLIVIEHFFSTKKILPMANEVYYLENGLELTLDGKALKLSFTDFDSIKLYTGNSFHYVLLTLKDRLDFGQRFGFLSKTSGFYKHPDTVDFLTRMEKEFKIYTPSKKAAVIPPPEFWREKTK